jgi:nitroreductase
LTAAIDPRFQELIMSEIVRAAAHPVSEIFTQRWSPRAFTKAEISDSDLMTMFEAARWAPSASNLQPWRMVYSKRGSENHANFLAALNPGNQIWAKEAAALVCFASKTTLNKDGAEIASATHSLDTGAAWMAFALQATMLGWHVHGMVGFNQDAARKALSVPEGFALNLCVAVGKLGAKTLLPEAIAARENPSHRQPLSEIVFAERMPIAK